MAMILEELIVGNFRSIRDETFRFPSLAILIGKNNTGKTNVLEAARILLEGTSKDVSSADFFDPSGDIDIARCHIRREAVELVYLDSGRPAAERKGSGCRPVVKRREL